MEFGYAARALLSTLCFSIDMLARYVGKVFLSADVPNMLNALHAFGNYIHVGGGGSYLGGGHVISQTMAVGKWGSDWGCSGGGLNAA